MYAIVRDRGQQHKVSEGQLVNLDLMADKQVGEVLEFNEILLTSDSDGAVKVGEPLVEGASVKAEIVDALFKGEKIDVVHFRRRKDSKKTIGHRQKYTRVKITQVVAG